MAEWITVGLAAFAMVGGLGVWLAKVGGGITRIEVGMAALVEEQFEARKSRKALYDKTSSHETWIQLHDQKHEMKRTGGVNP